MNHENNNLLKRAQTLYELLPNSSISPNSIENTEKALQIILPEDFKKFCTIYGYDYCRLFPFFSFGEGVISKTLEWRDSANFPKNCVALAEEGESAVIMRVTGDNAEVIWCDIPDLYNLCEGKPMEYNPTIFPSFVDFYSFLLDEEEKLRNKENTT